ncbi:MAG TPA: hypothetical protein VGK50_04160 [Coriobacteriia bacterium]|jgi:uncharacterized membrane protein
MADNGTKETTRQTTPLDVMVATFADRQAAKDAYQTLKTMDKEGVITMDGAVVIDRDEMGKVRLEGATLPAWLWAVFAGVGAMMFGMLGVVIWLGVMAVRGMRTHPGEHSHPPGEREREREGIRMSME